MVYKIDIIFFNDTTIMPTIKYQKDSSYKKDEYMKIVKVIRIFKEIL